MDSKTPKVSSVPLVTVTQLQGRPLGHVTCALAQRLKLRQALNLVSLLLLEILNNFEQGTPGSPFALSLQNM